MRRISALLAGRRWLWAAGLLVIVACAALLPALHNCAAEPVDTERQQPAQTIATAGGKLALGFASGHDPADKAGNKQSPYDTAEVQVVRRHATLRLTGSLSADELSSVASNTNGIVAEVRVDRGSVVKKGDVMVQLDPTDAKNRLSEGLAMVEELKAKLLLAEGPEPFVAEEQPGVKLSKATLALADSRRKRAELLLPQHAISVDDCEQMRSEYDCCQQRYEQALREARQNYQSYKTAESKLAALKKAVADATITAPFDGMVAEKNVAVGEQVTGGFIASKVITLVRTNPLRVALTVPQQSIAEIKPGRKVNFEVDSFPQQTFTAEVRYISPVVSGDTRSLVVEAVTPNADGLLRPGLFVTAQLELPQEHTEMYLPLSAVQKAGEVSRVFVVREGDVREQIVAVGSARDSRVEILSGLEGSERVVCNAEQVRKGTTVR
jgi:RND family efflux transporter MFP subunit